ncbi:SMI1/KNR4 family protein [Rhodococcus pyridinivorans]|uniref:SMI1/KNR4 family protein n=1 Tax=Rhodococcus pyridinivorans TaxID=103816 RepID=UPI00110E39CE|nr:SMI1/KNR4 family protein [Rhodococcus pyridinivorans]
MSLERNWQRLYDWCVRQAPATAAAMSSPAEVSLLDTVESATGRRWPTELRAWFGLHNGTSEGKPFAQVLPSFEPLSLERVSSVWTSMTATWADMTDELGGTALLDEPAGTMSFTYLSAYIPIAENDQGDLLVVDTRAGEQHGCVRDFAGEDADQSMMVWSSIEALVGDVASAVERSEPCFGWLPVVKNGALDWELP